MSTPAVDIRWQQRFENLQSAYKKLQHAVQVHTQIPDDELIQMAVIKAFEMTFELSWKTLKDYLQYNGISVKLPREIIKQAFSSKLILDGQLWINMLEDRNLMAHTYDEKRAKQAILSICQHYLPGIEQVHDYLQTRLS